MRSSPPRGSGWVQPVGFENLANSHADHQPTRYRVVVLTSCRVDDRLLRQSHQSAKGVGSGVLPQSERRSCTRKYEFNLDKTPKAFASSSPRNKTPKAFANSSPRNKTPKPFANSSPRNKTPKAFANSSPRNKTLKAFANSSARNKTPKAFANSSPRLELATTLGVPKTR